MARRAQRAIADPHVRQGRYEACEQLLATLERQTAKVVSFQIKQIEDVVQ
jgi:hypothetical protein